MNHDNQLEELRSEGRLTASGEFRLDRDKAREKMQKFQLRDPHHYVLEFVQAAHLLGADDIRFDIDADEMRVQLTNVSVTADDLEDIYDAVFSASTDPRTRALRHLAIGLNAAQAMEPSVVRVKSVRDDQKVTLEIRAGEEVMTEEAVQPGDDHTTIYLRETFRASHLLDFFRNLRGDLAEKTALREGCASSTRAIHLDGERISLGPTLSEEVVGQAEIETPHERGVIGILPHGAAIEITILQNGVKVVEHRMKARLVAARAVIESDRLTKNLSQSAFVEDEGWTAFIEQVIPAAIHASIGTYVSALSAEQVGAHLDWLRMLCVRLIPKTDRLPTAKNPTDDLVERLASLALWPAIDHGQTPATQQRVSIREFVYESTGQVRDSVPYTQRHYPDNRLEEVRPALFFANKPPGLFASLCGEHFVDITNEYDCAYEREQNKKLWASRPWHAQPSTTDYPLQQRFRHGDLQATIWINDNRRQDALLFLVHDGHLLRQRNLSALPSDRFKSDLVPGGLAITLAGTLPTNRAFDGLNADTALVELAFRVVEALPDFIAAHAERFDAQALQTYLARVLFGKVHTSLLDVLGVSLFERIGWLRDVAKQSSESPWALVDQLLNSDERSTLTSDEVARRLALLGPITKIALFEGLWGSAISLQDLADEHRSSGEVWYVRASINRNRLLEITSRLDMAQSIVCVNADGEMLLERLFEKSMVYAPKKLIEADHPGLFDQSELDQSEPDQSEPDQSDEVKTPPPAEVVPPEPDRVDTPAEPDPIGVVTFEPEQVSPQKSISPPPANNLEARLIDRLRAQLVQARSEAHYLLDDTLLDAFSLDLDDSDLVARTYADGVHISPRHPATSYAQDNPGDAVALAFLGASVYTSINIFYEEITGSYEEMFLMRLVEHLDDERAQGTQS
jgi:hypothetical protein